MALAERDGKNAHRWDDVSFYVLHLAEPEYYKNPLVKYGYMRGSETHGYVKSIRQRWQQYRGVKGSPGNSAPQKSKNAKHRNKFQS
jgi:membrane-bound lytic murein transglycosylase F